MKVRGSRTIIRLLRGVERITSRKAFRFMIGVLPVIRPFLPKLGSFSVGLLQYIADRAKQWADTLEKKYKP